MIKIIHFLKTWPKFFKAVEEGKKPFEIRKNDRDYNLYDVLILEEYDPDINKYTGKILSMIVTYCMTDKPFVPEGYIALGIKKY